MMRHTWNRSGMIFGKPLRRPARRRRGCPAPAGSAEAVELAAVELVEAVSSGRLGDRMQAALWGLDVKPLAEVVVDAYEAAAGAR